MSWYIEVLKKYAVFRGRARRREYWMFILVHAIIYVVLLGVDTGLGGAGVIPALYSLGVVIPSLAVGVRRLHDTGRSGWWLLLSLIPLIGTIVLIVFTVQDSQPGENQYGPNPKLGDAPDQASQTP